MAVTLILGQRQVAEVPTQHCSFLFGGRPYQQVNELSLDDGKQYFYAKYLAETIYGRLQVIAALVDSCARIISHTTAAWIWCVQSADPSPIHLSVPGRIPRCRDPFIWHQIPSADSPVTDYYQIGEYLLPSPQLTFMQCQLLSRPLQAKANWCPKRFKFLDMSGFNRTHSPTGRKHPVDFPNIRQNSV